MALLLSGGTEHIGMAPLIQSAGNGSVAGIPFPRSSSAVVTLILAVLTLRTLWAAGSSPSAAIPMSRVARRAARPRDHELLHALGRDGGHCRLDLCRRTDAASPLAGVGMELDAVTAVIIGGASLFRRARTYRQRPDRRPDHRRHPQTA